MAKHNYHVSEETRRKLLSAAGELFAFRGVDGSSVRDITARAGTMPNAISYHFGGKDGLVSACMQCALGNWSDMRIMKYYKENESLFSTRDGCRQMVSDLIDIYFRSYGDETQPKWMNMLLLRSVLTGQWIGGEHEQICRQVLELFCDVFHRVSGNEDRMTAICWAMSIVSPAFLLGASNTDFVSLSSSGTGSRTFLRRLQSTITEQALFTAGLIDK